MQVSLGILGRSLRRKVSLNYTGLSKFPIRLDRKQSTYVVETKRGEYFQSCGKEGVAANPGQSDSRCPQCRLVWVWVPLLTCSSTFILLSHRKP